MWQDRWVERAGHGDRDGPNGVKGGGRGEGREAQDLNIVGQRRRCGKGHRGGDVEQGGGPTGVDRGEVDLCGACIGLESESSLKGAILLRTQGRGGGGPAREELGLVQSRL